MTSDSLIKRDKRMNMKRIFFLVLMALLLYLPMCSLAAVVDLSTHPVASGDITLLITEDTTIKGNTSAILYLNVSDSVTLTFDNAYADVIRIRQDGSITLKGTMSCDDIELHAEKDSIATLENFEAKHLWILPYSYKKNTITLNLRGSNSISNGIACYKPLCFSGNGSLFCKSLYGDSIVIYDNSIMINGGHITVEAGEGKGSAILVDGNDIPNASFIMNGGNLTARGNGTYAVAAWDDELRIDYPSSIILGNKGFAIVAGEDEASAKEVDSYTDEKYLKIAEIISPELKPELPKTGDTSNVLLWSALSFISLFGMIVLVRKRKEA